MNIPVAAYRLQFNSAFPFTAAGEILSYLRDMGISHIYASPVLQARSGSGHGYDTVDPKRISPELGGKEEFELLIKKVRASGLSWIQDIVPNHMAFDSENSLLMDVFERGPASPFHGFFDIDWDHPYTNLKGRALTPFLGGSYGTCLDKGEITLTLEEHGFRIKYYDIVLPVSLSFYPAILKKCFGWPRESEGFAPEISDRQARLLAMADGMAGDPGNTGAVLAVQAALWRDYTGDEATSAAIDGYLGQINNGNSASLDELHELISGQFFRLSFWKVGNDELNYRRFFTVNSLICLKAEDADVFKYTHAEIFRLIENGLIDGLRVDHIDGLNSPIVYMSRLRDAARDHYIVVEKILCEDEELPGSWPVQGTTGYDFLNYANGVFVAPGAEREMNRAYISFSGARSGFEALVVEKKRLFMGKHMAGDIDNLAHILKDIFKDNRYGADLTMYGLRRALVEVMAHFPVYRTYVSELGISYSDKFYIEQSVDRARRTGQELLYELDAIEKVLLLDPELRLDDREKEMCRRFTGRFQQFTGALMAKGAEDTADYIYNRLISLNEVGGFPDRFGVSADEFHAFNIKRRANWPHSMNTLSTHDTKRGEDVRARVNVLTEIPSGWQKAVSSWRKLNRRYKTRTSCGWAPDNNDEYLIYQTLAGAFPFAPEEYAAFTERMRQYIVKAVREAKVHTAWLKPDTQYEESCLKFISGILEASQNGRFLEDFIPFQQKIAHWGIFNSLSQTLLKLTAPGVPDIYQGTELWDLNLVDPDNRRPVDLRGRERILDSIKEGESDLPRLIEGLCARKEDGGIKLFTIYRALDTRKTFRGLFESGDYVPLVPEGELRDNVIVFARRDDKACCITVTPRFLSSVIKEGEFPFGVSAWKDTTITLPDGFPQKWENAFTGRTLDPGKNIRIADILDIFPVGLLTGQ